MSVSENATITSKGQVTIPKRIRDALDLDAGTEVEFVLEADGTIRVRPKEPAMERLRGVRKTLTTHDIDIERIRRESKTEWATDFGGGREIFLDSWVWLEFVFSGEKADEAEAVIERADSSEEGGLIAPTVIAEVSYRVRTVEDEATAAEAIRAIRDFEHIESVPLVDELAEYATELRVEYYEPGERELSYADAIHLATAVAHDECDTLCSGDPDFDGIEEIGTHVL